MVGCFCYTLHLVFLPDSAFEKKAETNLGAQMRVNWQLHLGSVFRAARIDQELDLIHIVQRLGQSAPRSSCSLNKTVRQQGANKQRALKCLGVRVSVTVQSPIRLPLIVQSHFPRTLYIKIIYAAFLPTIYGSTSD